MSTYAAILVLPNTLLLCWYDRWCNPSPYHKEHNHSFKIGKMFLYCFYINQLDIYTKPASNGYSEVIIPSVSLHLSYLVLKTLSL